MQLNILGGGASQALVGHFAKQFESDTGCAVTGEFGAVGAMKQKLLSGAPADLMILSAALIAGLAQGGQVLGDGVLDVGLVRTGVAVRAGDPVPAIGDAEGLRAAMAAADGIYFPDPALATAGIHFAKVLDGLGLGEAAKPLSRVFPNGATAMRALAASADKRPIGCTQITEIVATPGITLVGPLPAGFELVTTYTAGVCSRGDRQNLARRFAALIAAPEATETRRRLGFEG